MKPGIEIIRHPYEEPVHIHLELKISNDYVSSICDFYGNGDCCLEWAEVLEKFPRHTHDTYVWEIGSEYSEDRWAYYFRLRAFTTDSGNFQQKLYQLSSVKAESYGFFDGIMIPGNHLSRTLCFAISLQQ